MKVIFCIFALFCTTQTLGFESCEECLETIPLIGTWIHEGRDGRIRHFFLFVCSSFVNYPICSFLITFVLKKYRSFFIFCVRFFSEWTYEWKYYRSLSKKRTFVCSKKRCPSLGADDIASWLEENYCPTVEDEECAMHVNEMYPTMLEMIAEEFIILNSVR